MPASNRIAVAVPARNEGERIGACLDSLRPFLEAGDAVIVVDDASTDATGSIAAARGARVIRETVGTRGRTVACAYRIAAQGAECVLIVHADMIVPAGARSAILSALDTHPEAVGGALGHVIDDRRRRFRWLERGNRLRARRWQLPYGDQAQFVRTSCVEEAGGFPDLDIMEDLELSLRLRRRGRWLYLDDPVVIPARHWSRGVIRATLRNWSAAVRYRAARR